MVLDASVMLDLLLGTAAGRALQRRILDERPSLHAPHLLDVEVAHVLRRYERSGELTAARGRAALEDLGQLSLTRYPHVLLLSRIWELRSNLTGYDATYVALAELLSAPLVTRDRRLAASHGHRARIEVISAKAGP